MKLRLTCLRSIIRRVVLGVILITAPSVCVTRAKEQAVVAATPVPIFCAVFPREGGSLPEGLAVIPSSDVSRRFATSFRFLLVSARKAQSAASKCPVWSAQSRPAVKARSIPWVVEII
jgi:hypothetical protein